MSFPVSLPLPVLHHHFPPTTQNQPTNLLSPQRGQVCPRPKLEDILGGMGPGGTDRGAQQSGPGAAGGDGSGDSGSGSGNDSGTGNGDNGNGNGFINVARMSALQLLETFSAVVPR